MYKCTNVQMLLSLEDYNWHLYSQVVELASR